jgi:hypothetical protein
VTARLQTAGGSWSHLPAQGPGECYSFHHRHNTHTWHRAYQVELFCSRVEDGGEVRRAAKMGDFLHDSRERSATPEHIEGHGLAADYNSDNPNSPTFNPNTPPNTYDTMADPIDSAL